MKPNETRKGFAGKQISVDIERSCDVEREIVRHPGLLLYLRER